MSGQFADSNISGAANVTILGVESLESPCAGTQPRWSGQVLGPMEVNR